MMRQGSSPYVIQVLGIYQGRPPSSGPSKQLGLVMEFMERGSVASLQKNLGGAPPWPLVCRLAHEVALGINFLHSLSPAMLHLDLKPSNVLLDSHLKAKLTDFGLAQVYQSATRASKKNCKDEGGTISYMPPEAFSLSYSPTKASDIYSYGILLWSIVTGKQPYPNALSSVVRLRIPRGDRPSLKEISCQATGCAGLTGLIELMATCWEERVDKRPTSRECTTVTEEVFKMHKHAVVDAVHQVLKRLDQNEEERITEQFQRVHITEAAAHAGVGAGNIYDSVPTGRPPVQEMAGDWTTNQRDKARAKDYPSPQHSSVHHVDQTHSSKDHRLKVSSVHPIASSPSSPLIRSPQARTKAPQAAFRENLFPQYQRQHSSPDTLRCDLPVPRTISINLSHVNGVQCGNNNTMYISAPDPLERKRHPTAPSSVNIPGPRSGSWNDKKSGAD
nr:receptor-interacting serine/threonine-protein kinase 3-like isoform X2 [Monopterus albus]